MKKAAIPGKADQCLADLQQRLGRETEKRLQAERLCEDRLRFVTLLTEISAHFIHLPADRIDDRIADAHQRICKYLDVELSALWQWSERSPDTLTVTHLYGSPEAQSLAEGIDARKAFPWILQRVLRGEVVVLPTAKMPPEARRDEESRRRFGAKSSLAFPLSTGSGPIFGVLDFNFLKEERPWPASIVDQLKLIAEIFANALARKEAHVQLGFHRRLDALVADISTQFVNLSVDRIDAQIEYAQRRICNCIGVDLSTLWQWSQSAPRFMTLTHMHLPPDGPKIPVGIDSREAFPWAMGKLLRGEEVVTDTERLPPEAAIDQKSRRHFGIQSSMDIPLSTGDGPLVGILTFTCLKTEWSLPEPLMQKLRLIAQLFANALARKRSDLQLRESRARLGMATESAGVGLWVMESDSGGVWATPRTRELFQFAEGEALGYDSFDRRIDPKDRERVLQAVDAAFESDVQLDLEFRIVVPGGNDRWIKASGKRLPGAHGTGFRLMGASTDITARKKMEYQLRAQLEEIESLKQRLERENVHLRREIELNQVHKQIIGRSPVMRRVLGQVAQVAPTDATVLIQGETGTGKDLLAQKVHRLSARRKRPLVTVNCAALPPTLIESELFGREKGAYTGAMTRMTGRFEVADGATLFLDEIGELPLEVQAKLLRVLEEGRFERLGSTKALKVDVRIIAATNQKLDKQVSAGRFRKDLFYRLNVFPIGLPPLRERLEDIPELVWIFVKQYAEKAGKRFDRVSQECMDGLQRYAWPGNIRELRNVVERATIVCSGRTLEVYPPALSAAASSKDLSLVEVERRHLLEVLQQAGWRLSGPYGAAAILGLKRTTLYSKMRKLGIQRPTQVSK